jgi:hypothetical protein
LLNATKTSDDFTELYLRGKGLDLSVEAIVLRSQHRDLFSQSELVTARQRLRDVGYCPQADSSGVATDIEPDLVVSMTNESIPSQTTETIPPAIGDAEGLISRVKSVVGQPERNMGRCR